jgi:hypothetical protein
MKILTDFDGVLTEQTDEANRVRAIFISGLAKFGNITEEQALEFVSSAESAIAKDPFKNGWRWGSRLSAFCDEDLFIKNIGVSAYMDASAADQNASLQAIQINLAEHGFDSIGALNQDAYYKMTEETMQESKKPVDAHTQAVLKHYLDQGTEIVVVSNSGTERVIDILRGADLDPADHAKSPDAQFRVRGDAKKFALGDSPENIQINDITFDVDRPSFLTILADEKPDAVIGDVFSLDLALPIYLSQSQPEHFSNLQVFLRTQHYTPKWSREIMTSHKEENASLHLLDELPHLIEKLNW